MKARVATLSILLLGMPLYSYAAPLYRLTVLPTLVSGYTAGYTAINDRGEMTGYGGVSIGSVHAFVSSKGLVTDLGTLGGVSSFGESINDSGQVTGSSYLSNWQGSDAFLYSNGTMTDLGNLGGPSDGQGINDSGQVTGFSYLSGSGNNAAYHAILYSNGSMTDLGTLGGTDSIGFGINNSGQVAGESDISGSSQFCCNAVWHAFLYSNGSMTDLGTLGGMYSEAYAINDSGEVTGGASLPGNAEGAAFLYSGGVMTDLGTLGGGFATGFAINESGEVVGQSSTLSGGSTHAFLYTDGSMYDLNSLVVNLGSYTLTGALAINNTGQILAEDGSSSLLLSPCSVHMHCVRSPSVPEPGALWLFAGGLTGLALARRMSLKCWRRQGATHSRSASSDAG